MIEANSKNSLESETVGHSAGKVLQDVVTMADLQIELFKSDAGETVRRCVRPLAVLVGSAVWILATLPVCLIAIALGLAAAGLSLATAFGLIAALSMIAAVATAVWSWQWLRGVPAAFARSKEEFDRNISWIRWTVRDMVAKPRSEEDSQCNGH